MGVSLFFHVDMCTQYTVNHLANRASKAYVLTNSKSMKHTPPSVIEDDIMYTLLHYFRTIKTLENII